MSALSKTDLVIGTKYKLELRAVHIQNTDRLNIDSIRVTEPINGIDLTLTPGQGKDLEVIDTGRYYVTIRVNFPGGTYFINKQEIEVRYPPSSPPSCDRTKLVIESDIPYQGFGESEATTSLADVYFYYHKDENGDCEPLLKKPIIICDGFDPLDERPIGDIEKFFEFKNSLGQDIRAIEKLRSLGFDVIIMNFPVIGSKEVEFRAGVRNASNVYVNRDMRDGGADYTERNAMLMVKLIQMVNDALIDNSSTEKLCILGPSMGGQITRYALAYMEEQHALSVPKMDHNTRVWCSFDSPHHGANIPLGNSGLLASMGYVLNQSNAKEKFDQELLSKAAQQYLINQTIPIVLNIPFPIGYIILNQNNSAPNRQTYLSSLTSNGLSGSNGWPQNVKRIAVANSSDRGILNGTPGQEALHIKGTVANFRAVEFQSFLQNNFNFTNSPLFYAYARGRGEVLVDLTNSNPPGSMDILPGSLTNSTEEIVKGIVYGINERNKDHAKITVKTLSFKPKHTFMPVISSLGFYDTDINWGQILSDRDLVCTEEIPFHAYKISGENQDHITITEDIYNWLEYQFLHGDVGCDPICGNYSVSGDQKICDGNTSTVHTYTLSGNIPTGQSVAWEVSGDISIDNTSGNTVEIKITTSIGSGILKGILTNGCGDKLERSYTVLIGKSDISLTADFDESSCAFEVTINFVPADKTPLSYEWSTNGTSYTNGAITKTFFMPAHYTSKQVYARANWGCDYTYDDIMLEFPEVTDCDDNWPAPVTIHKESNTKEELMLTPNPTTHGWQLSIPERLSDNYEITLTDANNKLIRNYKSTSIQNVLIIEGEALKPGMYFLKIISKTNQFSLRAIKI